MTTLDAFDPLFVPALAIEHEQVEAAAIAWGVPSTAAVEFAELEHAQIGVWEMTAGGMFDTEVDEIFVVVSGSGTVSLVDDNAPSIALRAGIICRLRAGMKTRWDVTEPLRKIYIAGASRLGDEI